MFDFLPYAEAVTLRHAPVQQVLAQVRFAQQLALGTPEGIAPVHEALVESYPRLLQEQEQVLTMTSSGVTTATRLQHRLTDLSQSWSAVIGPDHVTVETSAYTSWAALRERVEAALTAVNDSVHLRVRERIGLRYINHLAADADGTFIDRVRPELLGPASDPGWLPNLTTTLSQAIATDGPAQLLLRHGMSAEQFGSYLIDIDCVDGNAAPFSLEETLNYFDRMNDAGYRCFCWCVPETHRKQLVS
ncbi:TIGR04255 family protein [Sphaerimonospora thailandensis]|uniref:Uncharacterized protein n=1 Tax=Sphaerimonospora thailandensis TaxID=795644 RepID=A0A8J3W1H5_9ACTN|nr:TIGR04255 family protein [Sphaerimonospora thailandensis]GIH72200.1 hypothetical protein Mth01_44530 [Sphaerimonospora thailandensis]